MSAVNANTGEIVWRKPLGSYDELEAQGLKNTGAPNIGGSIATAGGLVFIAATTDSKFRAFDSRTGEELWVTKLDASGTTVPMTYLGSDGKQYVVVAAGGTNRFRMIANTADKNSDTLIAFAISDQQQVGSSPQPNSSPATQPSSTASGSTAGASSTGAMADLPEGQGKATVVAVCTKCHGPNNFTTLRMSRSAWESEVAEMKDKGAVGTDDDFKQVVDYLAKNFPPR
jgi:quinoprotein glucose dehydrogenase